MTVPFDLAIVDGTLVTPWGVLKATIGVRNGQIAAILGPDERVRSQELADARGCLVVPGGVDPHVHFANPSMGTFTAHDFRIGSEAAVLGGTTTYIDFAFQQPGETPLDTLRMRRAAAEGQSVADFSLHGCITDPSPASVGQVHQMLAEGYSSLKVFLVYRGEGWMVDDGDLLDILKALHRAGGTLLVHAENEAMLQRGIRECVDRGDMGASAHALSRPPHVEEEAVNKMAYLAELSSCPVYIVHVSSAGSASIIRRARERGVPIAGETCPHYLTFDDSYLARADGHRWVMSPPLRPARHIEPLWQALINGSLSAVGSDDAAYFDEYKQRGIADFRLIANGVPGAQVRLPVMFSEGVTRRGMSLETFVRLTSTAPAQIFGLYPKKGILAPGSDADLVIIDPEYVWKGTLDRMHTNIEYTLYEDVEFRGIPRDVWIRGRQVVAGRELVPVTGAGSGHFIARSTRNTV